MSSSNGKEDQEYSIVGPFERPSFGWIGLYPTAIVLSLATIDSILSLILNDHSLHMKVQATISLAFSIACYYLLIGYRYMLWATPIKNVLYYQMLSEPKIISIRFNRYFLDKEIEDSIPAKGMFKRLNQRDLRDVVEEANKILPIILKS